MTGDPIQLEKGRHNFIESLTIRIYGTVLTVTVTAATEATVLAVA